jgi:amino acid transporter
MSEDPKQERQQSGFLAAMSAVFWSFFGVRKEADHARSAPQLKPQHYIAAGLLGAAIFIFVLLCIVHLVLKLVPHG